MRRALVTGLLLLLALLSITVVPPLAQPALAAPSPPKPRDHSPRYRDGFVLVAFDNGISAKDQRHIENAVQAHEVRTLGVGAHLLRVPTGEVLTVVNLLKAMPGVRYAEPDYLSEEAGVTPSDPSFGLQWAYQNTGQTVNGAAGTAGADEKATAAWSVTTGSPNIVIGEVDTGVDYTHPDLAANIWSNPGGINGCPAGTHGYNVLTGVCDPMDDETQYGGHGTHVAGIMGAVGNNGVGVTGVNWKTTILPVKWIDASGNGATSSLITALDWLVQAKQAGVNVRIVNDSDVFYGTAYSQALSDEIDKLGQNNILFVTAGGNTSDNNDNPAVRRYPCGYDRPTELCVMGSDQNDAKPSWANYGPTTVDLAAPGNNIYSTLRNGRYGFISGSSMAAPQVSGAAALILSVQDMTAQQLKADILEHVDALPSMSGVVRTGGRLDICAAIPGCAAPSQQTTATLGLSSVGSTSDTFAVDRKRVNHYTLATAASVSKLSLYLQPSGSSGQQALEGVLYADANGAPGALLGVSSPLTFTSTSAAGWYDLPFASAIALQPGTYWIGVMTGATSGVAGFRYNSVAGARVYNSNSYSSGPSNPFGSATTDTEQMSLYATYTAASGTSLPSAPFSVTPPEVTESGQGGYFNPQVGQALGVYNGVWDFSPTTYTYQWSRCDATGVNCTAISAATSATYTPASADGGRTLRVAVTAASANGSATASSPPTQIVQAPTLPNTFGKTAIGSQVDPSGSNAERVEVFPVSQAVYVTKLTIYLERWSSGQQVLEGAIYADQNGAPGALLGTSSQLTFGTSATTGWYDLPFASPISISAGNYWIGLIDGSSPNVFALAYDSGPNNSSDLIYTSYAGGPPNPFGSGSLQTEQVSLYATYTTSLPTAAPTNATPPAISGTPQAGQTLTTTTGNWNNSPTSYAYQWSRCDATGTNCSAISGATSATYTAAAADVGSTLEVGVTASNAIGSATASSTPTSAVQAAPSGGTFGLSSVGSTSDTFAVDRKRVNHYTLATAASVSKLSLYLQPGGSSGQQALEGVLYADANGAPGALLGVSSPLTFTSTSAAGWYDLPFASAIALQPGTYWIGVMTGATSGVAGFRYNSVAGARVYNSNSYSSGPSNPFGSATTDTEQMSLYATYQ